MVQDRSVSAALSCSLTACAQTSLSADQGHPSASVQCHNPRHITPLPAQHPGTSSVVWLLWVYEGVRPTCLCPRPFAEQQVDRSYTSSVLPNSPGRLCVSTAVLQRSCSALRSSGFLSELTDSSGSKTWSEPESPRHADRLCSLCHSVPPVALPPI